MIDFIKLDIRHVGVQNLLNNEYIKNWERTYSDCGKVDKHVGEFEGIKFTINHSYIELSGSIHKYYNRLNRLGNQNHNIFTLGNLKWVCEDLEDKFGILPDLAKIKNVEYGLNFQIEKNPTQFINENIIAYKYHPTSEVRYYSHGGYLTRYQFAEYEVKIYDKTAQYLLDENILRFEVKTKKSRHIKFSRARTLHDLTNEETFQSLRDNLISKVKSLKIIDKIDSNDIYYLKIINPKFWEEIDKESNYKKYINMRKYKSYIEENNLITEKSKLLSFIETEFQSYIIDNEIVLL